MKVNLSLLREIAYLNMAQGAPEITRKLHLKNICASLVIEVITHRSVSKCRGYLVLSHHCAVPTLLCFCVELKWTGWSPEILNHCVIEHWFTTVSDALIISKMLINNTKLKFPSWNLKYIHTQILKLYIHFKVLFIRTHFVQHYKITLIQPLHILLSECTGKSFST